MAALVTVDDFRIVSAQGSLQATEDEGFIQGARKFIVNDVAAEPVNDDEQIHEAFGHRDVGDVNSPNLV